MKAVEAMATEAATTKSQKRERMLSLELASRLFDWSSIALAVGACIVFVATATIVWLGIVKEHHWDLLRELANEKIAAVGLDAAKSNAEAAKAHERIAELSTQAEELKKGTAEANERAAGLEKQAAELKAANLALEKEIAPRLISDDTITAMRPAISKFKGKRVAVFSYALDVEALAIAVRIMEWLKAEGIEVQNFTTSVTPYGSVGFGIHLAGPNAELIDAIRNALVSTGKQIVAKEAITEPGHLGHMTAKASNASDAMILVGVKPPTRTK